MVNWYKKAQAAYDDFINSPKRTYNDFGHPKEYIDSDPVYIWWYDSGSIIVEKVEDEDHVHQDFHGMVFWGRHLPKNNAVSLAWDYFEANEETYLDVLLALEEKFGQDAKLFISHYGKGLMGPQTVDQAIKQVSNFSESQSAFHTRNSLK